jgi:putative transcriptional regulator
MMGNACAPTEMLADYAAGALSEGMCLLVAGHLGFCPACRDRVARFEAIGGALLAEGGDAPVTPGCLARVLARIAAPCAARAPAAEGELPAPLGLRLPSPVCDLHWRALRPGLQECRLDGFPAEAVGLLRALPGTALSRPEQCGREARLVLAGEIRAGGRAYRRGDLALGGGCPPEAAGSGPCLCLVVAPREGGAAARLGRA